MSEWQEVRLGEVAEVTSSKRIFYSDYVREGIPFWRSKEVIEKFDRKEISTDLFITPEKYFEIKNRFGVPQPNDILLTSVGTLGIPYLVKDNEHFYFKDGNLTWIRNIDEQRLSPRYLYTWLASQQGRDSLRGITIGSTQEALTIVGLKSLNLLLPPLPEQKAIAAVLSSLDDKIDLLHRQSKTLEAMAETLFRQWFVEEAQEDWEEGTLGEVVDIFDGQRIPLSKMERDKKKDGILYPYYGAAQIMDYINDYIFDGEYILLGEDGTVRTNEGNPVLQYATGKFWVNNHTHVLQAKAPYSNFFLWNYLSKKNIDEIVTGAVQPKINQGNLKSLVFPRFPKKLVVEYNGITEPVLAKIQHNKTQISGLETLRDTLLPKLMSGEVRVHG